MDAIEPTVIDADEPRARSPRPRKARAPKPQNGKRSLNLSLDNETYERLAVHALRGDVTISELVTRLANDNLREYHITRTPGRS